LIAYSVGKLNKVDVLSSLTKAKRETGEIPVRTRRCNGRVSPRMSLQPKGCGKTGDMMRPEPEDLHTTWLQDNGTSIFRAAKRID